MTCQPSSTRFCVSWDANSQGLFINNGPATAVNLLEKTSYEFEIGSMHGQTFVLAESDPLTAHAMCNVSASIVAGLGLSWSGDFGTENTSFIVNPSLVDMPDKIIRFGTCSVVGGQVASFAGDVAVDCVASLDHYCISSLEEGGCFINAGASSASLLSHNKDIILRAQPALFFTSTNFFLSPGVDAAGVFFTRQGDQASQRWSAGITTGPEGPGQPPYPLV